MGELNGNFKQNSNYDDAPYTVDITNQPLNEEVFRQYYKYDPSKKPTARQKLKKELMCTKYTFLNLFPILKWLPKYNIKEDLSRDIVAGCTVAVMHIPQGMAYALLGGVPPIVGLYMAFFPVWIYIIMGTSRHVSMGTFAVICMMVSKPVLKYSIAGDIEYKHYNASDGPFTKDLDVKYSAIEVATAVCFIVGIWQTLLGIFKLGSLSVLLSETLVSGFTTGAAIHVLTSQITNLLGLSIKRYSGPLKLVYTYIDIFKDIGKCNEVAIALSVAFILLLVLFNEFVKPFLKKKYPNCNVPVPIELIVIVTGTLLSSGLNMAEEFHVKIVGDVPTGLPPPQVPPLDLVPNIIVDGLVIAVVAISINLSMATIFSRKLNYEIDGNQELLASGCGNIFGSFFSCMPFSASLSRSLIQETVGGRTQLASVVSCTLLLFVLLFIGPFFEPLPNCVLSSIIVVALKGMLFQMKDFVKNFKLSRLDGLVWMLTFLSVVLLDIDYGLGVGIVLSIICMLIRGQSPQVLVLGHVPNTNLYLDLASYKAAVQLPTILILKLVGGLHFANCDSVRKSVLLDFVEFQKQNPSIITQDAEKPEQKIAVIFDFASVSYLDPSSVKMILSLYSDFKKSNCLLFICECSDSVYESLEKCHFFQSFPKINIFLSISDAVCVVNSNDRTAT